jgi:hypothetical protein
VLSAITWLIVFADDDVKPTSFPAVSRSPSQKLAIAATTRLNGSSQKKRR